MNYRHYLTNFISAAALVANFCIPSIASATDPDVLKMVFVPASEKGDDSDYESLINIISERAGVKIESIKVTGRSVGLKTLTPKVGRPLTSPDTNSEI